MDTHKKLLALMSDDPFHLLDVKKREVALENPENKTYIDGFEEINAFFEKNGYEPRPNASSIYEFQLYSRLKAIRSDNAKLRVLKPYDRNNLFAGNTIREMTIEDIFSDDDQGLLSLDSDSSIFKLRHISPSNRIRPEYLSRRKICKDFSLYEDMFAAIRNELDSNQRHLVSYSVKQLMPETFFVLNGIIFFLKDINGKTDKFSFQSGERIRYDGRTRCIFDNGTESDMLFRSLDKAMQLDGYSISPLENNCSPIDKTTETKNDCFNGYIYILKSKNRKVVHIHDLYKIGYTAGTVDSRIKNAKQEATYLFDDVEVVSTFRCLNLNSYHLEQIIHSFFASARLDIKLFDRDGNIYVPKEWFVVPLAVVEEVIELIVNGKISNYVYDDKIKRIVICGEH